MLCIGSRVFGRYPGWHGFWLWSLMMGLASPSFSVSFSLFLFPSTTTCENIARERLMQVKNVFLWTQLATTLILHSLQSMTTCGTKRAVLYLLMAGNFRKTSTCFLYDLLDVGSTLTASSFRIFNNSPPLALFLVMLPKSHLTLYSRMSGSMWVSPASSSSRSLRPFNLVLLCILAISS